MRLTRVKDQYPCRIKDCDAEEWIEELTGCSSYNFNSAIICDNCPFEKYINKLAEYEDAAENLYDDCK